MDDIALSRRGVKADSSGSPAYLQVRQATHERRYDAATTWNILVSLLFRTLAVRPLQQANRGFPGISLYNSCILQGGHSELELDGIFVPELFVDATTELLVAESHQPSLFLTDCGMVLPGVFVGPGFPQVSSRSPRATSPSKWGYHNLVALIPTRQHARSRFA